MPGEKTGRSRRRAPEGEPSGSVFSRLVAESPAHFEGAFVLDELPGETGFYLWLCLRDVRLWASTPAAERPRVFVGNASIEVVHALRVRMDLPDDVAIAAVVLADLPQVSGFADGGILAAACGVVADWAGTAAPKTAAAFAQAGALAAPSLAPAAANAGFSALQLQDLSRAETWLRRAAAIGRRTDPMTFAHARATLGTLYAARGDTLRARSAFLQAIRATQGRPHALELRAQAAIGLYRQAVARQDAREADRAAHIALRAFGRRHPAFLVVGLELAAQWLDRGLNARALAMLKRLRAFRGSRWQRVTTLTLLARAAAASADEPTLRRAWKRVLALISTELGDAEAIQALVRLVSDAGAGAPRRRAAAVLREALRKAREIGRTDLVPDELVLRYLPLDENERRG